MLRVSLLAILAVLALVSVVIGHRSSVAAGTPTAAATPTHGEPRVEVLYSALYPDAALPTGSTLNFILWHASIAPGVRVAAPATYGSCCPGPVILHVLSGELSLGVGGPLQVVRAGRGGTPAPVEEIAEHAEVTLGPGDGAAYRFEFPAVYANAGATPVHLVSGGLLGAYAPAPVGDYVVTEFTEIFPAPPLPAGPVTMELVRVTLAPGESLPPPPAGALRLGLQEAGGGILAEELASSFVNIGREAIVVDVLAIYPRTGASALMP
jgi:hypothetical protein